MSAKPFTKTDYLGEPVIIKRGYQLCALLTICEQAASSLDNVGDGKYRDRAASSLSNTLELAEEIASELLVALEQARPAVKGGANNG